MASETTIDYEGLQQEAMRGVVRTVLAETAKSGLAGEHHFYVSFDTEAQGVMLSKRLREKYPREMTIVLQHRFWDLAVTDDRFEVKLTFDGIPERLVVPFSAIKVFFDPSVRYGLQFEDLSQGSSGPHSNNTNALDTLRPGAGRTGQVRGKAQRSVKKSRTETTADAASVATPPIPVAKPAESANVKAGPPPAAASSDAPASEPKEPRGAEIVSLDKFRKK